jgi:hypothetical protein
VKKRGYLGIDESNHGKFPEIYAAVFSRRLKDVEKKMHIAKKRRNRNIFSFLEGREFRYILVPGEYKEILGSNDNVMAVVICEFVRCFGDLEMILVGGRVSKNVCEKIEMILERECPFIVGEPKADVHYPLVNLADGVANFLFRQYSLSRRVGERYLDYLVTPKLEDYLDIFC